MPNKLFPDIFQPRYFLQDIIQKPQNIQVNGYTIRSLKLDYCVVWKKMNSVCNRNEHMPTRGLQVLNLTLQHRRICMHPYTVCHTARCSLYRCCMMASCHFCNLRTCKKLLPKSGLNSRTVLQILAQYQFKLNSSQ